MTGGTEVFPVVMVGTAAEGVRLAGLEEFVRQHGLGSTSVPKLDLTGGPGPLLEKLRDLGIPRERCLVLATEMEEVDASRKAGAVPLHVGPPGTKAALAAAATTRALREISPTEIRELWRERPFAEEPPAEALTELRRLLRTSGIADHLDILYADGDLWERFARLAAHGGSTPVPLRPPPCLDHGAHLWWWLWAVGRPVPKDELESTLGDATELSMGSGLFEISRSRVTARQIVLSIDGILQLKERPRDDPERVPRWTSRHTCLESDTRTSTWEMYRCLESRPRKILDIGTGTGFTLHWFLRRFPEAEGLAVDVDDRAVRLTRANGVLNGVDGRSDARQGDLFEAIDDADGPFDLILFHPPYRLLPEDVTYPDPQFRRGEGPDGLCLVRRCVQRVGDHLDPRGEALVYLDLPIIRGSGEKAVQELASKDSNLQLDFLPLVPISERRTAEQLAAATAEKCGVKPAEAGFEELKSRILAVYTDHDIESVHRGLLRARHRG